MSERKLTEVKRDKFTDFSFYLLAGGLAASLLLVIVYIIINL